MCQSDVIPQGKLFLRDFKAHVFHTTWNNLCFSCVYVERKIMQPVYIHLYSSWEDVVWLCIHKSDRFFAFLFRGRGRGFCYQYGFIFA